MHIHKQNSGSGYFVGVGPVFPSSAARRKRNDETLSISDVIKKYDNISFGFSAVDPHKFASNLHNSSVLAMKSGFWCKDLSWKLARKDSVLYYCVTSNGDVVYGVNGEDKGVCLSGVDLKSQLWGMLDVFANSKGIQLVDCEIL